MFTRFFKDSNEISLMKSIISLTASGIILFVAISFAWFMFDQGPTASDLVLSADYSECNVNYKTFKNSEEISNTSLFTNAKPGDIITYELEITNLKADGNLTVSLQGISFENSILINGVTRDIRDAYSVNLVLPSTDPPISLSGQSNVNVLSNYPLAKNGVVTVKFNLIFLTNPPLIPDVNVFQGNFKLKVSTLNISIN